MKQTRYAFLVKAPGYGPETHRHVLESPDFRAEIVGVEAVEQAIDAAGALVDGGVQIIELCGGFSAEEAQRIIEQAACQVPIGHIVFTGGEEEKLGRFLAS